MNKYQKKVNRLAKFLKTMDFDGDSLRAFKILARELLKVYKKSPFRKEEMRN